MTFRNILRDATAEQHRRLDEVAAHMALDTPRGYGAFLVAQAEALLPVERALEDGGIARHLPDWPARRRAPALLADLDELRLAVAPIRAPALGCGAALMGAAYVLEGSRLGARFLRPRVSGPARFLDHGAGLALWQSFLAALEASPAVQSTPDRAAAASRSVFRLFEQSFARQMAGAA
ncbi:MAG TPA: biliverdin-producing heme oxygenase [Rhizomicrobium sp.]|nr:biliverdin-producing heme oxygenase [Rhizomicrobium sp.]